MRCWSWRSAACPAGSAGLNDAQIHQNSNNRAADRLLSVFDVRNRLTFSGVWELPFGSKQRFFSNAHGLTQHLVNGWQANTVVQFQDGSPFNPTEQGDIAQTGGQSTQRPDRIADGNLQVSQRTPNRWFDTSAFVLAVPGTFGNSGRNILFSNGTKNVDLSLFKNNYFGERTYNLQFRAELFNLLNDTNFGIPATAVNGPNLGVVSTTGPAREIQFALKFIF